MHQRERWKLLVKKLKDIIKAVASLKRSCWRARTYLGNKSAPLIYRLNMYMQTNQAAYSARFGLNKLFLNV